MSGDLFYLVPTVYSSAHLPSRASCEFWSVLEPSRVTTYTLTISSPLEEDFHACPSPTPSSLPSDTLVPSIGSCITVGGSKSPWDLFLSPSPPHIPSSRNPSTSRTAGRHPSVKSIVQSSSKPMTSSLPHPLTPSLSHCSSPTIVHKTAPNCMPLPQPNCTPSTATVSAASIVTNSTLKALPPHGTPVSTPKALPQGTPQWYCQVDMDSESFLASSVVSLPLPPRHSPIDSVQLVHEGKTVVPILTSDSRVLFCTVVPASSAGGVVSTAGGLATQETASGLTWAIPLNSNTGNQVFRLPSSPGVPLPQTTSSFSTPTSKAMTSVAMTTDPRVQYPNADAIRKFKIPKHNVPRSTPRALRCQPAAADRAPSQKVAEGAPSRDVVARSTCWRRYQAGLPSNPHSLTFTLTAANGRSWTNTSLKGWHSKYSIP